jgi:hypothetical protein
MDVELRHTLRHVDVEGVHVDVVATPRQLLAAGADNQPGEVVDGAAGTMRSGNPLRGSQRDRPRVTGISMSALMSLRGASVRSALIRIGWLAHCAAAGKTPGNIKKIVTNIAADVTCGARRRKGWNKTAS